MKKRKTTSFNKFHSTIGTSMIYWKRENISGDVYCKDCGILISSGKVTKKYDHDWDRGRVTKEATCKEEGYTGDIYCSICDALLEKGTILSKLEYQWSNGRITKKATYKAEGELTYHCRKCAAKKIVSIKKLAYPKAGTVYTIEG